MSSVVSMECVIKVVHPISSMLVAKQSLYSCSKLKRSCFCCSFKSELLRSNFNSCCPDFDNGMLSRVVSFVHVFGCKLLMCDPFRFGMF